MFAWNVFVGVLLLASAHRVLSAWTYEKQEEWGGVCQEGLRQSPIDIVTSEAEKMHEDRLHFEYNATKFGSIKMTNTGHGFKLYGGNLQRLRLTHGGLEGKYKFAQFHFHWTNDTSSYAGSEHRVDGAHFIAEVHLVHMKDKFADLSEALASNEVNALAVVGVLIDVGDQQPAGAWKKIHLGLDSVLSSGEEVTLDLNEMTVMNILPKDLLHFYRYEGSLTTPTCNEQVVWTVLKERIKMSKSLVEKMAEVKDGAGNALGYTARDAMPLNGRMVYYNSPAPVVKPVPCAASSNLASLFHAFFVAAALAYSFIVKS
jgi:carbonic anhydrase